MIPFLAAFLILAQDVASFRNLDFEEGKKGEPPPGWTLRTQPGYAAALTEVGAKQGKLCAFLERKTDEPTSSSFGNLLQKIDARPYRGKRLHIRAYVRVELGQSRAQMWVRVDREGGEKGYLDNMADRPVRSSKWSECEIMADVDEDAEKIFLGLMLYGNGRAYWDDIRVEVLEGTSDVGNEAARPLEGQALDNVAAFARLFGYLRYFYPGDEAAEANWERFAQDGVRIVEPAKDSEDLARLLEEWSRPVAPALRVFPKKKVDEVRASYASCKEGARKIVFWHHRGLGFSPEPQGLYRSWRVREEYVPERDFPEGAPNPEQPYFAELPGGVSCLIPCALYEDDRGTLPVAPKRSSVEPPQRPRWYTPSAKDRATRIVNIVLAWNVFQHFYPYFDVVGTDWLSVLPKALQAAATDSDEMAFLRTLRRLVAQLHDGHGHVFFRKDSETFVPPISWEWVEGKLVITKVIGSAAGDLRPGDVVFEVDGVPSEIALESMEASISAATPQWARWRSCQQLLRGRLGSALSLTLHRSKGDPRNVRLVRAIGPSSPQIQMLEQEDRPDQFSEISPGVVYVDLTRIGLPEFEGALPDLAEAKGIVFDVRGYPERMEPRFLSYLTEKSLVSPRWLTPEIRFPDRQHWTFDESSWTIAPASPYLKAKLAFLTDGRAISYAETVLGIIEHHKLGEIVGGPTAGTNGNINPFSVPGGYTIYWTGLRVLKQDGAPHHGVGILPTIPVARTIRGIVGRQDELLDKAIAIVSK